MSKNYKPFNGFNKIKEIPLESCVQVQSRWTNSKGTTLLRRDNSSDDDDSDSYQPYPNRKLAAKIEKEGNLALAKTASDIVDLLVDKLRKGQPVDDVKRELQQALVITSRNLEDAVLRKVLEKLRAEGRQC